MTPEENSYRRRLATLPKRLVARAQVFEESAGAVLGFEAIAVRLALARGELTVEQVQSPCKVPLYASGAEACAAGLAGVRRPGVRAKRAMARLVGKGIGVDSVGRK